MKRALLSTSSKSVGTFRVSLLWSKRPTIESLQLKFWFSSKIQESIIGSSTLLFEWNDAAKIWNAARWQLKKMSMIFRIIQVLSVCGTGLTGHRGLKDLRRLLLNSRVSSVPARATRRVVNHLFSLRSGSKTHTHARTGQVEDFHFSSENKTRNRFNPEHFFGG